MNNKRLIKPLIPSRVIVGILGCLGCTLVYILRSNLSVAIIAMVDKKDNIMTSDLMDGKSFCYDALRVNQTDYTNRKGKYSWSESVQGVILGSYFYGYSITQISGSFADKFGAKWICGLGVFLPSVCNALIPFLSEIHYSLVISMRFMIGALHGVVYSSIFSLFAKWFPYSEKSLALTGTMVAGNLGGVITMPLSAYLSEMDFLEGWPIVFYFTSIIHVIWFFFWCQFVNNCPEDDINISQTELTYILKHNSNSRNSKNISIPWTAILTSRAVWASTIAKSTGNFGYYLLCTKMPQYLDSIFGMSIHTNSYFNSLMYITICVSHLSGGPLSSWIRNKNWISQTRNRKNFQSFAMFGCAACLILVPIVECNREAVIALLMIGMFVYGFITGGEYSTPTEFAPDLSGTAYGVANTFASTTGFIGPLIVGLLLEQDTTSGIRHQWNIVWYLSAVIYILGGIVFELFGSAEPQTWAVLDNETGSETITKVTVICDKF